MNYKAWMKAYCANKDIPEGNLARDILKDEPEKESIPISYLKMIKEELKKLDTEDGFMYAAGIDTANQLWGEQYEPNGDYEKGLEIMNKNKFKVFKKDNYKGFFYGKNEFSLLKDDKEVLHTCSYCGKKNQEGFEECITLYETISEKIKKKGETINETD